jgi:DNA excision repair protein ERCC-4
MTACASVSGKLAPPAPVLVIDSREQPPLPFSRLQTRLGTLAAGDYGIAGIANLGLFSIEPKSIEDLVACMGANRGRFQAQLLRLRGYSFARLLVVDTEETILQHRYHSAINPRAVLASLYAFEARYVPIVWSPTPQTAARLVERYATWFARELRRSANLLQGSQVESAQLSKIGRLNEHRDEKPNTATDTQVD